MSRSCICLLYIRTWLDAWVVLVRAKACSERMLPSMLLELNSSALALTKSGTAPFPSLDNTSCRRRPLALPKTPSSFWSILVSRSMSYLADQLKEKGNAAFRNGDFVEAEDLYTQAVQKYSRNPLIFTNRANVRLKLQRWDGAVNDCLKSIEITGPNGQNHKAFYFLGKASTVSVRFFASARTRSPHSLCDSLQI